MRSRLIAVVGSGGEPPPALLEQAESLGAALVHAGYGIVTGGRGGVQEAVCRGALRKRGQATSPPLVGILSGYDVTAGHPYIDVALPTGLGQARHALIASCGEVLVCIGGATGALAEVALARKIGRPVVALAATGGTAGLVAKTFDSVHGVATVDEAIEQIAALLPA